MNFGPIHFLLNLKKKKYIFFECYNYFSKKGKIQCIEVKRNSVLKRKTILKKNYHLSYPFIFNFKNKFYLVPESYQKLQTSIYESVKFPYEWKKINTIFKGEKICDTTIFFKNKKFWLFVNKSKKDINEFNKNLHIYSSRDINFNNLIPHYKNPVLKSMKNGRNAGPIFFKRKLHFRPSQINKKNQYGYGITISKLTKLSKTEFKQAEILKITPKELNNRNICGIHHYCKIDDKTFITDLCFRYSF